MESNFTMSEHVEALVELMRRTIEQKDDQIHELYKTVDQLNETSMISSRPLQTLMKRSKNSAGNTLDHPAKDHITERN